MIHDLDKTLRSLIHHEMKLDEDQISFEQPTGEWSGRISRPTINFFLYDVRENSHLRRHQWQASDGANGVRVRGGKAKKDANGSGIGLKRTPLFMDCFYMVTAWGAASDFTKPFIEHELLSKSMLALARYPILNPGVEERTLSDVMQKSDRPKPTKRNPNPGDVTIQLEAVASGRTISTQQVENRAWLYDDNENLVRHQRFEISTRIAHHDVLTNPSEVWSAIENQMKAGFSYVVTLQLDPWSSMVQMVEPVRTVEIRTGQPLPTSHDRKKDEEEVVATANGVGATKNQPIASIAGGSLSNVLYRIGGTVKSKNAGKKTADNRSEKPSKPAPALRVTILDAKLIDGERTSGLYRRTLTDHQGRFSFRRLRPGEYIILVGSDLDAPLATENVEVWSSQGDLPKHGENILIEIEVDLPEEV